MTTNCFNIKMLGEAKFDNPSLTLHGPTVEDTYRLPYEPQFNIKTGYDMKKREAESFEIAGPREKIYFNPRRTKAAIVSCGGLCPGINSVIRALVKQLWYRYGVENIIGIRYGYRGLSSNSPDQFVHFHPDMVEDIDRKGGTILGSSRGIGSISDIVDTLERNNINQLYTIGGDGTMRGAQAIHEEIERRNLKISIIGIPKTIDNDIPFVRRSFGFETAVSIACDAVVSTHNEAKGTPNGIGLIKLMGRHSGYIAANAALATGHANFCLIPEVPFDLEGEHGLLNLIDKRLQVKDHALIIVAEGAGQNFFENLTEKDASGNAKMGDIGPFLRDKIDSYLKSKGVNFSIKYVDPSYLIRSAPATFADALLCSRLAGEAVHAAMAGKTGMLIGHWHGQMTHVPLKSLAGKSQRIKADGNLWFNVLESTGQPCMMAPSK